MQAACCTALAALCEDEGNAQLALGVHVLDMLCEVIDRATHGALPHRAPSTGGTADLVGHVWRRSTQLKPSNDAVIELNAVPAGRQLVPRIVCPLFCIDGLQTTDKESGVNSLPLFARKAQGHTWCTVTHLAPSPHG